MSQELRALLLESLLQDEPIRVLKAVEALDFQTLARLRDRLRNNRVPPNLHHRFSSWLWHENPRIAHCCRVLALLLSSDAALTVHILGVIAMDLELEIPFRIEFDASAREFSVDLHGVPGWGISDYGRDKGVNGQVLDHLRVIFDRANPKE